jgi:hypothetical protein
LAILDSSFRWFASRLVPGANPRKRAVLGVTLVVFAGCGGSEGSSGEQVVRGPGYTFAAPEDWSVTRAGREQQAAQGTALVSVTLFPLQRAFRPALWNRVVPELDRAAQAVARQQQGTIAESVDVTIAGRKARRYDVAYERDGKQLVERLAFLLHGKTEYLLLCRYESGGDTGACDRLLESFKLAAA